jgi:hypothetical protein
VLGLIQDNLIININEYIVGLSGRCGDFIDSIRLQTNKRTSPVYGGSGGNREFRIDVPSGNQALGFTGRSGGYLDAIGFNYVEIESSKHGPPRRGRSGSFN